MNADINSGVNKRGNQDTTGNTSNYDALETARTIGGVSFDGTGKTNLPGNEQQNQDTSGNHAHHTQPATGKNTQVLVSMELLISSLNNN